MGGGRRLLCALAGSLAALTVPATAGAADPAPAVAAAPAKQSPSPSWAAPQIASVVLAGVMGPSVVAFRPDDSLTREELHAAILAVGKPHQAPTDPTRVVTMRELDAQLVAAAGLLPAARTIRLNSAVVIPSGVAEPAMW